MSYKADSYNEVLSKEKLAQNIQAIGISNYDQKDFEALVDRLSLNG